MKNCVFTRLVLIAVNLLLLSACTGQSSESDLTDSGGLFNTTRDTTAPTAAILSAIAVTLSETTSSTILNWTASNDDRSVAGYRVIRDNAVIFTTTSTSYTDTNLAPGTNYEYSIITFDDTNNVSSSNMESISTPENIDTTAPTAAILSASGTTSASTTLSWTASQDNTSVAGYRVIRDNTIIITTTNTSYTDTSLVPGTNYEYSIVAFDNTNNVSNSNLLSVSTTAVNTTGAATLNWTPPTENTDDTTLTNLTGYKIHYGLSPSSLTNTITINNAGISSYVIDNLSSSRTYYFSVTAINSFNVESSYSNIASKYITAI